MVFLKKSGFELMLEESIGLTELTPGEVREYNLLQTKAERHDAVTKQLREDYAKLQDSLYRSIDADAEEQTRARREPSRQIGSIVYN